MTSAEAACREHCFEAPDTVGARSRQQARYGRLWIAAAAAGLAALIFSARSFLSGNHAADLLLLFGMPPPFDPTAPVGPRWLKDLSWDLTAIGSPGFVGTAVVIVSGGLVIAGRAALAARLVICIGSGTALGLTLKRAFGAIRPHHGLDRATELNTSFPSGHALLASLLSFSLALLVVSAAPPHSRVRLARFSLAAATLVSFLVGASRVHLGLHWPTDVVAGWIVGAGWALLFWASAKLLGQRLRDLALR